MIEAPIERTITAAKQYRVVGADVAPDTEQLNLIGLAIGGKFLTLMGKILCIRRQIQ